MSGNKTFLRTVACTATLAAFSVGAAQAADLTVRTEAGRIQGFTKSVLASDRDVEVFLGVPYAASPTGDRRFKKAERPVAWEGIRDGSVMPPACKQASGGSEDCLYVNIYRPAGAKKGDRLPVAVFAHGGANTAGQARDFDGARFAAYNKQIVVTIQYRLGAFGFLNVPGMGAEEAGNLGVEDTKDALWWIRRNIERFGGDQFNVVLMSQSAGSTNACRIIVDKGAKRLLHGVVLQSEDCLHDVDTTEQSRKRSLEFIKAAGCDGESDVLACLRSLSSDEILKASRSVRIWNPTADTPAVTLIARGEWNKMPVLLGANREEGRSAGAAFIGRTAAEYKTWMERLLGPAARQALVRYPAYKYTNKYAIPYVMGDVITDSGMRGLGGCTNIALARAFVKGEAPVVYLYEFQDSKAPMKARMSDYQNLASHGAELAYLWPDSLRYQPLSNKFNGEQWELSNAMRRYWGLFVRYKNPNQRGLPSWRNFNASGSVMALNPEGSKTVPVEEIENTHKCSFWSQQPPIMDRGE